MALVNGDALSLYEGGLMHKDISENIPTHSPCHQGAD